jgi:hypothetical protein
MEKKVMELKGMIPNVRWNLTAISSDSQDQIGEALSNGYEPFAVTHQMKKLPAGISQIGPQQGMTFETIIWFKQPVVIDGPKQEFDEKINPPADAG